MGCIEGAWNGVKPPCKDCAERYVGCHSQCDAYQSYVEKNQRNREEIQRAKRMDYNPNVKKKARKGGRWL